MRVQLPLFLNLKWFNCLTMHPIQQLLYTAHFRLRFRERLAVNFSPVTSAYRSVLPCARAYICMDHERTWNWEARPIIHLRLQFPLQSHATTVCSIVHWMWCVRSYKWLFVLAQSIVQRSGMDNLFDFEAVSANGKTQCFSNFRARSIKFYNTWSEHKIF